MNKVRADGKGSPGELEPVVVTYAVIGSDVKLVKKDGRGVHSWQEPLHHGVETDGIRVHIGRRYHGSEWRTVLNEDFRAGIGVTGGVGVIRVRARQGEIG